MIDVVQQSLFDYASLDADTRMFVQEKAQAIQARLKRTAEDIIAIGQDLEAVKDKLPRGQFVLWLQFEFEMSQPAAYRFMQVAARFKNNFIKLINLPISVIYELAAPSTPDTVIEMVETQQIPATIPAIREAKQEAQRETFPPGFGLVDGKPFDMPLPDGKPVEIPDDWKLPASVRTPNTYEGGSTVRTPVEIDRGLSYADKEAHPILNTLTSKSNEWYTPQKYVDAAREVMGGIDTDPASNALANEKVRARNFYDIQTNGLDKDWTGRVWLNPPYGRDEAGSNQDIWSKRLIEQYEAGITTEAILLVNAAVDTKWFQRLFQYPVCFPDHRINFYSSESSASGSTHGSALIYFGSHSDRFFEIFSEFGTVVRRW